PLIPPNQLRGPGSLYLVEGNSFRKVCDVDPPLLTGKLQKSPTLDHVRRRLENGKFSLRGGYVDELNARPSCNASLSRIREGRSKSKARTNCSERICFTAFSFRSSASRRTLRPSRACARNCSPRKGTAKAAACSTDLSLAAPAWRYGSGNSASDSIRFPSTGWPWTASRRAIKSPNRRSSSSLRVL